MAKSKQTAKSKPAQSPGLVKAIGWVVLTGVWLLLVASMISHDPQDPPAYHYGVPNETVHNWVGLVGAWVSHKLYFMLGPGVWVLLAGVGAYLGVTLAGRKIGQLWLRAAGVVVMALVVSAFFGLLPWLLGQTSEGPTWQGGLLSLYINDQLTQRVDLFGSLVVLAVVFLVGALLSADEFMLALPKWVYHMITRTAQAVPKPALVGSGSKADKAKADKGPGVFEKMAGGLSALAFWRRISEEEADTATSPRGSRKAGDLDRFDIDEDSGGYAGTESFGNETRSANDPAEEEDEAEAFQGVANDEPQEEEESEDTAEQAEPEPKDGNFDPAALREKIRKLPVNIAKKQAQASDDIPREQDFSGYQFPSVDLLDMPDDNEDLEREKLVRDQAQILQEALQTYGIEAEVVGIDSGPTITMYEVSLAPGTKVNSISRVSSDIARSLKAQNIRVVPNMVGRDTVGIEVPNLKREKVVLRELMTSNTEAMNKMKLPMWLGKDASGEPLVHDLHAMPHMLIAGTTGSGKSVCMNSIIMSFLYTKRPDELKLVLVDPKMVEMSMYKDVPHLMCPVVTEMAKAAAILEWAVTKMDERYELLAEAGVRDIKTYNELGWEEIKERISPNTEEEEARIPKKLPYMVFIIDELADLMMTNKEVEAHIVRIAQKARAVGMHLILATQRPQANVVTGLIKGNMPCRISFRVASKLDSRIVLDQGGAELLLGHGDMMFLNPKTSKISRAQGTFIDDMEIRKVCKFLKGVATPTFERQLTQIRTAEDRTVDEEAMSDDLFDDAVRVVLEAKRGSVSLLQRRLTIGYGRASRLIEAMATAGILGEHKGSQAREVLMGIDEWEALKAQAEADADSGETVAEDDDALDAVDAYNSNKDDNNFVPDEMDGEYRQ